MILRFQPIYQERVWGGRWMAEKLGRQLPGTQPIGESWELVDREEAQSVVCSGLHEGISLHSLWSERRTEIFGARSPGSARFPVLVKILDASDKLSLQVHPPAHLAPELGGEPKTEMWYIMDTRPSADLFVGLQAGTTKESFEKALTAGTVASCFHRIETQPGDCMFLPSGRVHAIGAGNLICEIQQNSDTTYRVYDWDRVGLDGKPRELHIEASLRSIDFSDAAPSLQPRDADPLVTCDYFQVRTLPLSGQSSLTIGTDSFVWVVVVQGSVILDGEPLGLGDMVLLPAGQESVACEALPEATLLTVQWQGSAALR